MYILDPTRLKLTFTTHAAPLAAMAAAAPVSQDPGIGDLIIAEVTQLRRHSAVENRDGARINIYPGDLIVGAFGNRYATDQYEAYVPSSIVETCDLLSVGGVLGEVRSRATDMRLPTRLRVVGAVCDSDGRPLRLQQFGLRPITDDAGAPVGARRPEIILAVGASMNSGKTTTVGTLARGLTTAGFRVAAAKVTGTASSKDGRFYLSNGASPVLEFTDVGYPATYMLERDQLLWIYQTLVSHLRASRPDYIILEIADGIFQRETRMLLESPELRADVDHVFFNALDSLSAAQGVRTLTEYGLPPKAIVGTITKSPLMMREAEEVTGIRCLSLSQLQAGAAVKAVGARPRPRVGGALERATLGLIHQAGSGHSDIEPGSTGPAAPAPTGASLTDTDSGSAHQNGVLGSGSHRNGSGQNGAAHDPSTQLRESSAEARPMAPARN